MKLMLVAIILLSFSSSTSGQKIFLKQGDVRVLKGIKSIATEITYDNLLVGAEIAEEAFIKNKMELWDKKEAGKGEDWERHWQDSKTSLYEPTFGGYFARAAGISIDQNAPYKLVLKTKQIEPGFNGGPVSRPAFIIAELWVVDSREASNVIAKFALERIKGDSRNGGDFEMGFRIQRAYLNAGQTLGLYFKENIL